MQGKLLFISAIAFILQISQGAASPVLAETVATLTVTSPAFSEAATVPKKYTGSGEDFSPPITWTAGPEGSKSYAVTCEDPDAPGATWWHWILFNIRPETNQLAENLPKVGILAHGVLQGINDFHKPGYNGPAPPGGKLHHYQFKVMALDKMLSLGPNAGKEAFKNALKGHVLAVGVITTVYRR